MDIEELQRRAGINEYQNVTGITGRGQNPLKLLSPEAFLGIIDMVIQGIGNRNPSTLNDQQKTLLARQIVQQLKADQGPAGGAAR